MIQYKVVPKTSYQIIRSEQSEPEYEGAGVSGGVSTFGDYHDEDTAIKVAYMLCKMEHEKSGEPIDSMNFIYPKMSEDSSPILS